MSMFHCCLAGLVGLNVLVLLPAIGHSADWPQWRGPKRDGVVLEAAAPRTWPAALKEEWQTTVGEGISSPVVFGQSVFVLTRQEEMEVVSCVDLASGKVRWRSEPYPAPYEPHPAALDFGKRPRSTPAVAAGRVYALGITGVLSCFDGRTGKLLWRKETDKHPIFGASTSPLVADGLCIVHMGGIGTGKGGLTAYDAATGEETWCFQDFSSPAYGSPILADLGGQRQVVTFTAWNLIGVSAATGKLLWKVPARFDGLERCITPVLYKDLIIFAAYKEPLRAIRLEKTAAGLEARDVWQADEPTLYMSTPVLHGKLLVGMSDQKFGHYFGLDTETGKLLWQTGGRQGHNASILRVDDAFLLLNTQGQLTIAKSNAAAFEPIVQYQVSELQTWAHPVFLGDRILIKDHLTLRLLRLSGN
jgi:outer membrane protein assembly factor BamB